MDQMLEDLKLRGELIIRHIRGDETIDERVIKNLVVSAGKALVAGLINAEETVGFTYLAIGTGSTAASAGDTALQAEITTGGGARAAATCSQVTTTVTDDTAQLVKQWTFSAGFAVTEAGIFNAASGVTLLARQVFSAINVVSGDKLEITWKVQVT